MSTNRVKCDVLILGAGVIGISIGIAYLEAHEGKKVFIVEKEDQIGKHASGRNSGVLHAGFYYSPDSLKAKFCRDGNSEMRLIAKEYGVPVEEVGKVVVTQSEEEDSRLEVLLERGLKNGVELELLPEKYLRTYEPLAITKNRFLWSPKTAVADQSLILDSLRRKFESLGGRIRVEEEVKLRVSGNQVHDSRNRYDCKLIVNAAGAQADRVSREIGVGVDYAMLPFMGVYRFTTQSQLALSRLVYPVPHPINPFLGTHFTITSNGLVKIGPTAIPILGREQYTTWTGWSSADVFQALKASAALVKGEVHNFNSMLKSEWPKIFPSKLVEEAAKLVPSAAHIRRWDKKPSGIRSQLVHLDSGKLEQDFVVRQHLNSVHVLNAVSPGWASAIPFGRWVVKKYMRSDGNLD